jgi:GPI mannosyltransferase 3
MLVVIGAQGISRLPVLPTSLPARRLLMVALALGAGLRLWAATDDGIYWPDEIYQSFEPAHRLVYGYGMRAWEFIEGARNWSFAFLVAVLLKLSWVFGLSAPSQYILVVKGFFALAGTAAALGVYRLACTFNAAETFAAAAAAAFALAAPVIYFAPRAMAENGLAACAVWGLALVLDEKVPRKQLFTGAGLLGLGVLFRLQGAVYCAGALGWLLWRRQFTRARDAALVLLVFALLFGLTDAIAWHDAPGAKYGGWFHSAFKYWEFNITKNAGAGWGTSPWSYYFQFTYQAMPALSVVAAVGALASLRKALAGWICAGLFLALHVYVAHKELRFVVPLWPVFFALAGAGFCALPSPGLRRAGTAALLAAALFSAANIRALTMGDLGAYADRPQSSAWDDYGPVNRLMLAASKQPDVCGLRVDVAHLAWTGGITYLHHNAPLYHLGQPDHRLGFFNYVITREGSGLPEVAKEGGLALAKLPIASCTPDPGYTWRLP